MQYKSEKNEVTWPISEVLITRNKDDIITHMTIQIANSVFVHDFDEPTEIRIMAKVLTGKLSPSEGFNECMESCYTRGRDTNSYHSAIILRFTMSNSQECKPFISGAIFKEIEPHMENKTPSSYGFNISL